jgi:hypothetical protein
VVQNRLRCQPEGNDNCKREQNGTSSRVWWSGNCRIAGWCLERQEEKMEKALELAGGYVVITDVLQEGSSGNRCTTAT